MTPVPRHRARIWTVARWLFGLVGIGFLSTALLTTWDEGIARIHLSGWILAMGAALLLVAHAALAWSWAALFQDRGARSQLVRSYLRALPAKYIPGGWAQPVGQVALATGDGGVTLGRATVAYPIQVVCLTVAGAVLASGLVFSSHLTPALRWLPVSGLATVALLHRKWMMFALRTAGRVARREHWGDLVPSQPAIWRSFGWALVGLGAMSAAFVTLLVAVSPAHVAVLPGIGGYSFAWLGGFLALPFPAGVGIREGLLTLLFTDVLPAPQVIALALVHRLLQMGAELVLAIGSGFRAKV